MTCTEARVAGADEGRKEIRSGRGQAGREGCTTGMEHVRASHLKAFLRVLTFTLIEIGSSCGF